MGIDGVGCVRSIRDIGRRLLHGGVGVNGDRCPEGICCAEGKSGGDSVKDGCCGMKWVEDIPWNVPWLWCGDDEVCSGNQCQLLVKG